VRHTVGNNYRKLEEGFPPVDGIKGNKAKQHDELVKKIKRVLDIVGRYVMENPRGGLEKMPFMADWEDSRKHVVELCAYIWPFRKETNLWVQGIRWKPKGTTGSGRCEGKCGQGDTDPLTRRFKHFMTLATDPQKGPRGVGATSQTCGIPNGLIKEILVAVAERAALGGKVVLDLCAGFQSIRNEVLKAGAKYVGVDIQGRRQVKQGPTRRAAIVLRTGNKVLAVKTQTTDGKQFWRFPGREHDTQNDKSLHHTGVRALEQATGIGSETWRNRVVSGPVVHALTNTTYYTYNLNQPLLQVALRSSVDQQKESEKTVEVAWVDYKQAPGRDWWPEDRAVIARLAAMQ